MTIKLRHCQNLRREAVGRKESCSLTVHSSQCERLVLTENWELREMRCICGFQQGRRPAAVMPRVPPEKPSM